MSALYILSSHLVSTSRYITSWSSKYCPSTITSISFYRIHIIHCLLNLLIRKFGFKHGGNLGRHQPCTALGSCVPCKSNKCRLTVNTLLMNLVHKLKFVKV